MRRVGRRTDRLAVRSARGDAGVAERLRPAAERDRARAVMKVLHFNERLKDAIAWVEEQERAAPPSRHERRGRRWGHRGPRGDGYGPNGGGGPLTPPPGPTASTVSRRPATTRRG